MGVCASCEWMCVCEKEQERRKGRERGTAFLCAAASTASRRCTQVFQPADWSHPLSPNAPALAFGSRTIVRGRNSEFAGCWLETGNGSNTTALLGGLIDADQGHFIRNTYFKEVCLQRGKERKNNRTCFFFYIFQCTFQSIFKHFQLNFVKHYLNNHITGLFPHNKIPLVTSPFNPIYNNKEHHPTLKL